MLSLAIPVTSDFMCRCRAKLLNSTADCIIDFYFAATLQQILTGKEDIKVCC